MRDWLAALPGVRRDEPLAPHTTYDIGGPAEHYLEIGELAALAEVARSCANYGISLFVIGNGSNIVVADAGIDGVVVRYTDTAITIDGTTVRTAAGARMVKVAQAAAAQGLTGMEWALGIPGTAGGSVYSNAGCFGSETAAVARRVRGLDRAGGLRSWDASDCAFGYRTSAFRAGPLAGCLVTEAVFELEPGDPQQIRAEMERVQAERRRTQPVTGRSTGSVFKNPPGDFAARLIDEAGLKGRRVGGAMVSREHANFIVNTRSATANDVAALVRFVGDAVEDRYGIRLEPEIEWVGKWQPGLLR